jgi:hypothetical protein
MLAKGINLTPISGAKVTEADKTDPPYAVVLGQDPDQEGVKISVKVEQISGTIQYDQWEPSEVCTHYASSQPGRKTCDAQRSPDFETYGYGGYYYNNTVQVCNRNYSSDQGITVQRKIKDIKIWLEPSKPTSEWLGWDPVTPDGRNALRFLYPEKWMVGNWTDDGFTTQGTPGNIGFGSEYYKQWLEKMKGYNFLAGDALGDFAIWSVTMYAVLSPRDKTTTSLGLYGTFETDPDLPENITGPTITIPCSTWKNPNHASELGWAVGPEKEKCNIQPTPETPDEKNNEYSIILEHVPMDLPGEWYIGVMVEMEPAQFTSKVGNKTITEPNDWGNPAAKWYKPTPLDQPDEIGYHMDHSFYSYILLSSPCNIQEKDGCFDGSP